MKRIAIFPGSFNPFTIGHEDILIRGLKLFDHIVIGIGKNDMKPMDDADGRADELRRLYAHEKRISVDVYHELTVDFAKKHQAAFILRGVRSIKDYEYEQNIASINQQLAGIETVILFTKPAHACISSSVIRELQQYGKDVSEYLAKGITT